MTPPGLVCITMTSSGSRMIFRVTVSALNPCRISYQVARGMRLVAILYAHRRAAAVDLKGGLLQLELLLLQTFALQALPLIGD